VDKRPRYKVLSVGIYYALGEGVSMNGEQGQEPNIHLRSGHVTQRNTRAKNYRKLR